MHAKLVARVNHQGKVSRALLGCVHTPQLQQMTFWLVKGYSGKTYLTICIDIGHSFIAYCN